MTTGSAPLQWIDTHCHLDAREFDADRPAVVERANAAGVTLQVIPAVGVFNFDSVRALAHEHGQAYALGIHPLCVGAAAADDLDRLEQALRDHRDDPRLVAVGEIGVDLFVPGLAAIRPRQEHFYREQLKIARRAGLPVLVHVRRSSDAVLAGLRRIEVPGGIAHAFNGSDQQAAHFVERGFRLGFGGAVTFESALQIRRIAAALPGAGDRLAGHPAALALSNGRRARGAVARAGAGAQRAGRGGAHRAEPGGVARLVARGPGGAHAGQRAGGDARAGGAAVVAMNLDTLRMGKSRGALLDGDTTLGRRRRSVFTGSVAMFHLIWMFIVGIVVGAIARFLMPGAEHMGLLMTGLVGIAGSFIGGFIARLFSKPADGAIVHPAGILLSVIGALILLYVIQRTGI